MIKIICDRCNKVCDINRYYEIKMDLRGNARYKKSMNVIEDEIHLCVPCAKDIFEIIYNPEKKENEIDKQWDTPAPGEKE